MYLRHSLPVFVYAVFICVDGNVMLDVSQMHFVSCGMTVLLGILLAVHVPLPVRF